jgi:purine-nucleoside phosphorylase
MLIEDHINFMGTNPLIGKNYEELGPRFPDMSSAYNRELITLAEKSAEKLGYTIKKGVYTAVSGPTYETPAELKMLRLIGGDAVGMSTVPEVIVANHMSMRILGISCITDMAIADNLEPLDHRKVLETANKAKTKFISIVKSVIEKL